MHSERAGAGVASYEEVMRMDISADKPESAFPRQLQDLQEQDAAYAGLTKREYFAVHMFQGVIANLSLNCTLEDKAKYAVEASDALVKALGSEQ